MKNGEIKNLILFSQITHISKDVTEEINSKYLKKFLESIFVQHNISIDNESQVYLYYAKDLKRYEIYLFRSKSKNNILELQLFSEYPYDPYDEKDYRLFITEEFFALYKNNKFLFGYENKSYTTVEIEKFILFTHNIRVDESIIINTDTLTQYKTNFDKINTLPIIRFQNKKQFYLYGVYGLFGVILLLIGYFYSSKLPQTDQQKIESISLLQNSPKKDIIQFLAKILDDGARYNIEFIKIEFKKSFHLQIKAIDTDLDKFLTSYKKSSKIIKIEKSHERFFLVEVTIEVPR